MYGSNRCFLVTIEEGPGSSNELYVVDNLNMMIISTLVTPVAASEAR